nr:MAG: hypothetical protein [Bacteriophage sp.]
MLVKIGIFLIAVAVAKLIVSAIIYFRQRKGK